MMPVPSPQGDPKQLARPVGPREPEAPQGSERVWTHKGSGVGLYRFYAGVHPSRLGTARAGAPRGWLWGSYHPSGTSGSDSRLLPIKIAAAMHGSASGWPAGWRARCACAGAVVRQWRACRAAACSRAGAARARAAGCSHLSRALAVAPVLVRASPGAEKLPSETPGLRCTIDY